MFGNRDVERKRVLMENDGIELERRVMLHVNEPSINEPCMSLSSLKPQDGMARPYVEPVGVGGVHTGAAALNVWQPMCDTLPELENSGLEKSVSVGDTDRDRETPQQRHGPATGPHPSSVSVRGGGTREHSKSSSTFASGSEHFLQGRIRAASAGQTFEHVCSCYCSCFHIGMILGDFI